MKKIIILSLILLNVGCINTSTKQVIEELHEDECNAIREKGLIPTTGLCPNSKGIPRTNVITDNSVVYENSKIKKPARHLFVTEPLYPKNAYKSGIVGEVNVSLIINEIGRVINVEIINSNPEGIFEKATIKAVKSWSFIPGRINDETVLVRMTEKVKYCIPYCFFENYGTKKYN